MFALHEDINNPKLFTHFGTASPFFTLSSDSNSLQLSGNRDDIATVGVPLTMAQAEQVRAMTGANSTLALEVAILGSVIKIHLVGRKIDANEWAGTVAEYGDTETVTKDLENGLTFAEQVINEVNSLVIIIDANFRVKRFNKLCEEMTGMTEEQLVGRNAHDLFMPSEVRDESKDAISGFFKNEETYEVIRPIKTRFGIRTIHWRNKLMVSGSGVSESYLVCSGTDVTAEHDAKARLYELANKDMLTGLPNRHAITEQISNVLACDVPAAFGLIFLDLDNFKKVNDHFGHATGDMLIAQVAQAIGQVLSPRDTVARLGGDEFLVVVPTTSQADVQAAAQRILERMKEPFALARAEVYSGCSMGIAMYPEHGDSLEALIRAADTAMYVAKENGRRTFRFFDSEMNNRVREYIWLETNMRRALEEDEFELYYQPKVSLASGQVESVEALIRWNNPERGMIMPNAFIPYAEESGLIVPLGKWVLLAAAKQAGLWKKQGLNLRIAVNLSARQLHAPTLLEDFASAILTNDISPSLVDLELTESCLIDDEMQAHRLIRMFRELGAQIHLDDFGTGYSSLSHLARLPLDVLKLDGSFCLSIHTDARAQALVRAMVAVAQELDLKVVAECVETVEQADFLRSIGVDFAQGYLYGKPMQLHDFMTWFAAAKRTGLQRVA